MILTPAQHRVPSPHESSRVRGLHKEYTMKRNRSLRLLEKLAATGTGQPARRGAALLLAAAAASLISIQASSHGAPFLPLAYFSTATPEVDVNSAAPDGCPIESADGLSLFIASARPGGVPGNVGNDIWVSDRESLTSPWQPPKNLGEPVNSAANDFCPTP